MTSTRGFGLAGEAALNGIVTAARATERAGYDSFWLSQPGEGSTLSILSAVASETRRVRLGVGAIPLTSMTTEEIHQRVEQHNLPVERLRLGVGSGTGKGSLDRLRQGVDALRTLMDVEIVVAPLGPKMCALAGEVADTVLLNWLTPAHAETSIAWIQDGTSRAGRDTPLTATYVRCAMGEASGSRLEAECDRYGSFPHYAAHFDRQGVRPIDTTILAQSADELQERLGRYERVLDHVVVRAITPSEAPSEVLALVDAARPDR